MKILVTGATGFIGSHLVPELLKNKHEVVVLTRKSSDVTELKKQKVKIIKHPAFSNLGTQMQDESIDGILHLASLYLKNHSSKDVGDLIDSNVRFSTELLEAAAEAKLKFFINTGTFWQHYNDEEYSPVNLYAASKQAFIDIAQYYVETSSIKFVTLKLSDTFGPNDTRPKIFNYWLKAAKSGETLEMSAGEQILDISYIANVTAAYLKLLELLGKNKLKSGDNFALYSGEQYSLRDLHKIFEQETGLEVPINWGAKEYREREVMKPWSKGRKIPDFTPPCSLRDGIRISYGS